MILLSRHAVSRVAEAVRRALEWPARVSAAQGAMSELAQMSDERLRDIGLTRQEMYDVTGLRCRRCGGRHR
ncbi:uncharacterized protein DUF1127 [Roseiarcus fermentans]|uniref:Uncharacterized protein DUF1127 n=1 Tax=Roseiarcus fermentans TaxID=1473586 RepID=A0A366FPB6_9HYPH|nr:DUF1127 domain-containing protein [Roseiarcus fermentans]RBP16492.1 uncharacterized protein DUF1127 [Roseiarcus fermentans]